MSFDTNKFKPVENFSEDCLELKNYISGISTKIIQTFDSNENSCIGIVGKWGDGKTSAINLCLSKLKEYYSAHKKIDCFSVLVLVLIFILPIILLFLHKHSIGDFMISLFTPILDYNILSSLCLISVLCLLCGWKSYKIFISRIEKLLLKFIYKYSFRNQLVVIKFSPWNCSNSQQMVKEYLKLLSNELEIIESDISVKLLTYAKIINDNKFTNMMCAFATNQVLICIL